MARVTVEDCVKKIPNRFDLVIAAAQRSREISNGIAIEVDRDNDKNPVVSLREIASEAASVSSKTVPWKCLNSWLPFKRRTTEVDRISRLAGASNAGGRYASDDTTYWMDM